MSRDQRQTRARSPLCSVEGCGKDATHGYILDRDDDAVLSCEKHRAATQSFAEAVAATARRTIQGL